MLQMSQRQHASPITSCRIEIHPIIEHITTAQLKNFAFQTPESGITEPIKTAHFQTCTLRLEPISQNPWKILVCV